MRRSIESLGDVLRGTRCATDLDAAAKRQNLVRLLRVDARDGGATMAGAGHEPILLQAQQRLAHGSLAAAELASEPSSVRPTSGFISFIMIRRFTVS